MSRAASSLVLSSLGVAVVALSSCTASLDLDRFRKAESGLDGPDSGGPPPSVTFYDVRFTARGMTSHLNEFFELRVVDGANQVQAKFVYRDVAVADFTVYMKGVVPKANPPYRLDFWADHNRSGTYDGIVGGINEKDHAWRRRLDDPLPEDVQFVGGTRYELNFGHDTTFADIYTDLAGNKLDGKESLHPCKLNVRGAAGYIGKTFELRVVEKVSGRLVGVHRRANIPETFVADVTDVIDSAGTPYDILAYVDVDGDGKYTPTASPPDPSWKAEIVAAETALEGDFDIATLPLAPIETGE